MCVMVWCVKCVEGDDGSRGGGVVESRSGVGVVLWKSLLGEDVHCVYVSVRYRREVVLWTSIGVRIVLCHGCGFRIKRVGGLQCGYAGMRGGWCRFAG